MRILGAFNLVVLLSTLAVDSQMGTINSPRSGRIFQINISNGGVPKRAVPSAYISINGLVGDLQRNLQVHGGPDRAVCIYSLERIQSLQAEGHPIYPGAIGENLTISGLDWPIVSLESRFVIGKDVILQVTGFTSPCQSIVGAFSDQHVDRVSQAGCPGWSRVYAQVLFPGTVRTADIVLLENHL